MRSRRSVAAVVDVIRDEGTFLGAELSLQNRHRRKGSCFTQVEQSAARSHQPNLLLLKRTPAVGRQIVGGERVADVGEFGGEAVESYALVGRERTREARLQLAILQVASARSVQGEEGFVGAVLREQHPGEATQRRRPVA
jgi:hypothetical protein